MAIEAQTGFEPQTVARPQADRFDLGFGQQALRRMPHLRQVDLTSCPVGAATLRTLGECCPSLELLRLGSPVTDTSAGR